jgi:ferric-dicitrate binding protein FerR (iron transport regulator)
MKDAFEKNSKGASRMDEIGQLIKLAGAREAVPVERFDRVRQNVQAHWQQVVTERRGAKRAQRFNILAVAAGFILMAGASMMLWNLSRAPGAASLASVDRVLGEVQIGDKNAHENSAISANTPITTGSDGRIALRLIGGQSLRVDTASHVILHSPNHISLEAGAIYVDTAFAAGEAPILVSTPLGTAQDIGTQFQVRLTGMLLVVGVRNGLVEVSQPGQQNLSINKGYYVELDASGENGQHPLQPDDPNWDWIESVTPEFVIQGASLAEYLRWYAGERGVELVWADAASESRAAAAALAGSIAGASLDEGLLLVKQVAPFEHQLSGDTLWIKVE